MRHQKLYRNSPFRSLDRTLASDSGPRRNHLVLLSFLLLLLLSALVYARADDQVRAVRLSNVVGSVQILSGAETEFSQAYPNMPLMQGSTLKTGEDGRAEVQLEDGSMIRLTPNSSAAMSVLKRDSAGNTDSEVDLLTGLIYVEMKGTAKQRFVVHFQGNDVISPAPAKFRVNLDASPAELSVLDGSAHLSKGADYAIDVHANETVRFDATDTSRYILAEGVNPESWDQWNTDRDQAMSQMAARETREAIGSGQAGAAGVSDLDYYGNWYSSGNGSSFWVPNGAGPGWDPYGLGYWGYYGAAGGYMWISGYPWGWLPYQCGTWNYFSAASYTGWGWIPVSTCWGGGPWNGIYPSAGFGNLPPHYRPIPRPHPVNPVHPIRPGSPNPFRPGLIAVNRGPEATTLTPRAEPLPRTIDTGQGTAHLLAKTPSSTVTATNRPTQPGGKGDPVAVPVYARPTSGFSNVHQQAGNMPAFRPTGPAASNLPATSSFNSRLSSGTMSAPSHAGFSASAPSAGSAGGGFHGGGMSAPSGGGASSGAASGGGAHH
jgi:hypothetical protein